METKEWTTYFFIHLPYHPLKVPDSYEKYLRISYSVKGKPLPTPPSGREWATL